MTLPAQLILASLMVTFTIGVHLGGLAALLSLLRRHHAGRPVAYVLLHDSVGILAAAFGLFALHAI